VSPLTEQCGESRGALNLIPTKDYRNSCENRQDNDTLTRVAHVNVHKYVLMANCLASTWDGITCNQRDYIGVAATAKFYIDDEQPSEIKAELKASATDGLGKSLVLEWVEDCRDEYISILVGET
jgi:hypothetical protein